MKPRRHRSPAQLLKIVERMFMREIRSFDGGYRVAFRVQGHPPDRSVFAFARLDGCSSLAVARVYETDLDNDRDHALRLVYMLEDDLAVMLAVLQPRCSVSSPVPNMN